jgi:hypothetical protein
MEHLCVRGCARGAMVSLGTPLLTDVSVLHSRCCDWDTSTCWCEYVACGCYNVVGDTTTHWFEYFAGMIQLYFLCLSVRYASYMTCIRVWASVGRTLSVCVVFQGAYGTCMRGL